MLITLGCVYDQSTDKIIQIEKLLTPILRLYINSESMFPHAATGPFVVGLLQTVLLTFNRFAVRGRLALV